MGIFIPMDNYMVILEEVGRWKVIGMRKLYDLLELKLSYSLFCRNVKKLEYEGLIRTIVGMRRRKYLTLTYKGDEYTPYNAQFEECDVELNHDLIVSNVMLELNNYESFGACHVIHHHDFFEAQADGIVYFSSNGIQGSLAVEVELTQKSKSRITMKFVKYSNSKCFNFCLYIFNKESVFEAYKKQLDLMVESTREKIILMLDMNLSISSFNYKNNDCYFHGKTQTFTQLFSDGTQN